MARRSDRLETSSQPQQATGDRVPVQRDLRRSEGVLGLWPAWRRDQEQHQAAVVEDGRHRARRHRGPGFQRDSRARGLAGQRPCHRVRRPADRVPVLPQAVQARSPDRGVPGKARRQGARARPGRSGLPELRHQGRVHAAADVQRHAAYLLGRRPGRRVWPGLPAAGDGAGNFHQLQERACRRRARRSRSASARSANRSATRSRRATSSSARASSSRWRWSSSSSRAATRSGMSDGSPTGRRGTPTSG